MGASSSPTIEDTEAKEEWQPDRTPGDPGPKDFGVLVTARLLSTDHRAVATAWEP